MSVSHTIRYALFGELLTETFAAYQDAASRDPFGTWFVLPTRNLADVILRHPIAKERLILPDHMLTARDFAQYICRETDPDLYILSSGEQDLLIRRILTSPDLRKSTASLFGEVTHTTCSSLRTLITGLEQNLTDLSVIHSSTRKIETLSAIHQEYTRILKEEHLADKETVYETAVVALGSGKIPFRTVFIYGMYSLQPNEQAFINAIIATAESVHEVRPAVNNHAIFPGFTGEPIHGDPEKAAFAEGLFAGHEHRIPASLPVNLTTVIYPDTTAEVSSVLDQVSGLFEDGVGAEDILILSPAVKETVRLIDDIIDDFSIRNPDGTRTRISYTAATARPISNYPETAALLAVLKAPVADYPLATLLQLLTLPQIRKKFGIHTSQLFSLSQTLGITRGKSNWITIADQRIPFLLQKIEDAGTDSQSAKFYQVQIDELQKLQQGLISLIEEITPKNQKKQSVRQHCRDCLDLFIKLGLLEPVECEMPTEQQLRQKAFHDLISGLAASPVAQTISLTHAEFCDTLSELCSSTPAPLSPRTAKHTITVTGLRESALTSANHVFILGLSDKSIPRIQFTLPYLTVKETAKIKNTSFETDILREKYYFAAACLVAGESLHLSCAERDSSGALSPSSFFTRFPEQYKTQAPDFLSHSQTDNQMTAGLAVLNNTIADHPDLFGLPPYPPRKQETLQVCFGDLPDLAEQFSSAYNDQTTFAPTMLETYASCPFKWYLEKHLRLIPPVSSHSEERSMLGLVLHRIMERFFTEWTDPITLENKEDAKLCLTEIAAEEFDRPGFTSPEWEAEKNLYLTRRLFGVIDTELDPKLIPQPAAFRRLEQPLADTTAVSLPDAAPLRISGRPDRIDFFPDNSFTVYDYKSGDISTAKYNVKGLEAGISLQLPLYVAAVEAEDSGVSGAAAFYQIHPRGVKLQRFSKDVLYKHLPDILSYCKSYRSGMQNGVCSPNPNSSDCSYCPWRFVCRVTTGGEE